MLNQLAQDEGSYAGGFAVVEYNTAEHAEEVQQATDGMTIKGSKVQVSFCAPGAPGRSTLAALIAAQRVVSLMFFIRTKKNANPVLIYPNQLTIHWTFIIFPLHKDGVRRGRQEVAPGLPSLALPFLFFNLLWSWIPSPFVCSLPFLLRLSCRSPVPVCLSHGLSCPLTVSVIMPLIKWSVLDQRCQVYNSEFIQSPTSAARAPVSF